MKKRNALGWVMVDLAVNQIFEKRLNKITQSLSLDGLFYVFIMKGVFIMMTIDEVRDIKIGDTVVFNGGNSAVVMEIPVFGDDYYKHDVECTKEMYRHMVSAHYDIGTARMLPLIADVIFSGPATIVQWKDGTKTVVKCSEGENFDPEKGLVMAITKKALGNKGNYYETIKKWMHPGVTVLKTITVKSNGVETEINKVSSNDIEKIIDTMKPDGNFYCYDKKNKEYVAVDNTTGEAFTESFKDKKSCLDWLENKEKTV